MPINRRYPLAELRAALERFPLRPRERITVEYVLLAGVNDSLEDAERLAQAAESVSSIALSWLIAESPSSSENCLRTCSR